MDFSILTSLSGFRTLSYFTAGYLVTELQVCLSSLHTLPVAVQNSQNIKKSLYAIEYSVYAIVNFRKQFVYLPI